MARTVDTTAELMGDENGRSKRSLQLPITAKYLFMALVIGLLLVILAMGVKALRDAPPAVIHVSPKGLSTIQYNVLQQTMSQQSVSSFFTNDLQALRDIAMSLAWVDQVSITRDWQQGIIVDALPKQAIANFGTERLVDAKGVVFVPADSAELRQAQFATLQGSMTQAPAIMQQMQQINDWFAPLDMSVGDIILTPRMTWLIRFNNGLRVIVDNENTAQKLLSLSQVLNGQLSARRDEMQSIDLRYKNGFTIAWSVKDINSIVEDGSNATESSTP